MSTYVYLKQKWDEINIFCSIWETKKKKRKKTKCIESFNCE